MLASMKNFQLSKAIHFIALSIVLALYFLPTLAFATSNTYSSDTLKNSKDTMDGVVIHGSKTEEIPKVELPDVSIEVAQNYVERKGFDVIALMQTFAQPFTIGLFILGAFMALLGAFGKTGAVLKGVIVMAIAVVIYATVLYAPQLMDLGNAWLKS